MSQFLPKLFKGIAVVIDNEIGKGDRIDQIISSIREGGGHAIELLALPKSDYDLEHFSRVSFFILDWNLKSVSGDPGALGEVRMPDTLARSMIHENIDFLKRLSS